MNGHVAEFAGGERSAFAVTCGPDEEAPGSFSVAIVAAPWWIAGRPAGRMIWCQTFATESEARTCAALLDLPATDLDVIGRSAAVYGRRAVDAALRELVAAADDRRRLGEAAFAAAAEAARRAELISAYDIEHGPRKSPALGFRRRRDPANFLLLVFGERWERDRFWDWMRWRDGGFEDLPSRVAEIGAAEVERELMNGMMRTERRMRKAGLAAGGRRPLRFWRGDGE